MKALEDVSGLPEDLTESRGPFLFHREGGGETGLGGGDLLCSTKAFARDKTSRNFERGWKEVIRPLVSDGMSRCLRNTQNEDFSQK